MNNAHVSVYPLDASRLEANVINADIGNRNVELTPTFQKPAGLEAQRQQLRALDRNHEEAVEEPVGELGRGEVSQQLVLGDVADDPDVRVGGTQRRVSADRL